MMENEETLSFKAIQGPLTTKKAIVFFIIIGFVVYFNALFGSFVWDDWTNFLYNPQITNNGLSHFLGNNALNTGIYYRPFFTFYLTVFYNLFSAHPFFYHFFQVAIHIGSVSMLFYLFSKFINKKLSFFLCLFFLVHPIQVESVAWVSATLVPLSFLLGIGGLIVSFRKNNSYKVLVATYLLLLLSVFTRETGFIFFMLIILLQFIYRRGNAFRLLLVEGLVAATYLFCRFVYGKVYFDYDYFSPFRELTLLEKVINTPAVFFYYLKTLIFPYKLAINQQWIVKNPDLNNFVIPIIGITILFSAIIYFGRSLRKGNKQLFNLYLFFLTWFLFGCVTFTPFSPLDLTVADRYFYFPLAGLLGVIGVVLSTFELKNNIRSLILGSTILVLIILSLRTYARNANWNSYFALASHDIKIENNFDMQNMYGTLLVLENNDHRTALKHFLKSVEMFPHESSLKNVGSTYLNLGQKEKALEYFYKALEGKNFASNRTHNKSTYEALATLLFQEKNFKEAIRIATLGIKDHRDDLQLYLVLAISEYELKNQKKALNAATIAYKLSPNLQTKYLYTQILNNQPIKFNISN